jgi:hypothetical protein
MVDKNIYVMYEDIRDNGHLPQGMLFGNGMQTIKYTANGDATDWMATQNGMIAMSPELGTKNRMTDKFFPNQEWVKPIMTENFPWINYTMYKLSSQIETQIIRYTKTECQKACTEEDASYQKFLIEVRVENLGFSEAKNVEIKVNEVSPFEITTIDNRNKHDVLLNDTFLRHSSLKSLESKTWVFGARIPNVEWDRINAEGVLNSSGSKAFLEVETVKYPHFAQSQKSTRTLSKLSLMGSEVGSFEKEAYDESHLLYILAVAIILIVITVIICYIRKYRRNVEMINLEPDMGNEVEMSKSKDLEEDSEDGKIGNL